MLVLAVETASPAPAAALLRTDGDSHPEMEDVLPLGDRAAELLARHVSGLLARHGCGPSAIDRIAVASGPGSFTGLRAGAAFARGLARALGRPLFAFGTFDAASALLPDPRDADFVLDAGRGEVYLAARRNGLLGPPALALRAAVEGDAASANRTVIDLDLLATPLAGTLARLAAAAPGDRAGLLSLPLSYGRPSAAEEKFGPPPGDPA